MGWLIKRSIFVPPKKASITPILLSGRTNQACVASLRDDSQSIHVSKKQFKGSMVHSLDPRFEHQNHWEEDVLVVVAIFQDLGYLFCRRWLQDQLGLTAVLVQPVYVESLQIFTVLGNA